MLKSLRHLIWLLLPLGAIHLFIVCIRNKLYDWRIFKTKRLPRPVISIGNLQMGGTGKTPLTITVLQKLQNEGRTVGVLSRGYKRDSGEEVIVGNQNDRQNKNLYKKIGDEPSIILDKIAKGALGISADRYKVGKKMLEKYPVDLFLLDDGLQHRQLHRDVNICLIDVTRWKSHPFLFPLSYSRDCKLSLNRCQAVILTKIGNRQDKAEELKSRIKRKYGIPVFEGDLQPQELINIQDGEEPDFAKLKEQKTAAFCGIAHPDHFFEMLRMKGLNLGLEKRFPDHHDYSAGDLENLAKTMVEREIHAAITTQKDAVKLKSLNREGDFAQCEFFYLKVEFIIKDEKKFFEVVQKL